LLVAGELLDRFSERLIVGLGATMVAISIFAASRAQSYEALLGWLVVASIGYSSVQPGGGKAVASWFAPTSAASPWAFVRPACLLARRWRR